MKIRLVVFDLAGTTVLDNRNVERILQLALKKHGVFVKEEDANSVMGMPKPMAIRQLLSKYDAGGDKLELSVQRIHNDFIDLMKLFYETNPDVKEKPGASALFKKLKERKLKLIVDTGFDRVITNPLLKRMGWEKHGLIDGSVTNDEVARGRPHPDLIFKAMELTGIEDVHAVAKVGDTPYDLQEGKAAGCRWVIGITDGAFTRQQLQKEFHTHLIDNLSELESILIEG